MMILIKSIIVLVTLTQCKAEVFTSMTDMNLLLTTEGEMIRAVENYITTQEERLKKLKRDLIEMERVHDLAAHSPDTFLANPINAYLLIKRLTIDWGDLQNILIEDGVGQAMLKNLTDISEVLRWPNEEDLNGVAVALMRLQDTYKLDTTQLAQGNILGLKTAYRELTAGDCFELGRQSYNVGDHYHTLLWMNEALRRQEEEINKTVSRGDILEYLAFSTYVQGNIAQALKLTKELLQEKPGHKRALGNKSYYEEALMAENNKKRGDNEDLIDQQMKKMSTSPADKSEESKGDWQIERDNYERLCRGEGSMPVHMQARLLCHYQNGARPFMQIAPIKAEVVHINPTITIYHDVINDQEIELIKSLATPKFKRATVQNYKTGELETASYRISKSAWLKAEEAQEVERINERIEDITGLEMSTAEELQVANYGIGGHYEPHFDFARREEKDAFKSLGTGNRIATFLFYMTDVEAGGATVFPHLNLSLWPQKGAAAFWHNLHPSGEGDMLTRHAACPVLVGQKWVANKWIHERGQEFRRPCSLNQLEL